MPGHRLGPPPAVRPVYRLWGVELERIRTTVFLLQPPPHMVPIPLTLAKDTVPPPLVNLVALFPKKGAAILM